MEQQKREHTINMLTTKVQTLEKTLAQQMRNYLLRHKNPVPLTFHQHTQTEIDNKQTLESLPIITTSQQLTPLRKFSRDETISEVSCSIISNNQDFNELGASTITDRTVGDFQADSVLENIYSNGRDIEIWKLKKKIVKLKDKLKYLNEVSLIAKEGLLLSEEQNYQFRVKINSLQRLKQQKNTYLVIDQCVTNLTIYPTQATSNSSQVELERKIKDLQANLAQLRAQQQYREAMYIHQLDKIQQQKPLDLRDLEDQLQTLKDTCFDISNLIPLEADCSSHHFFRPYTLAESISTLERVLAYCRQIDKKEDERVRQIQSHKKSFVDFLKTMSIQLEGSSRKQLWLKTKQSNELQHYSQIFLDSSEDQADQQNKNQLLSC